MIQTAHADSGYANTRTRTARRTWSPLQQIISSQKGDRRHVANALLAFLYTKWIGNPLKVWPSGTALLTAS